MRQEVNPSWGCWGDELEKKEVFQRNVRLRAWKTWGLPLTGGWMYGLRALVFQLTCLTCGSQKTGQTGPMPEMLLLVEQRVLSRLISETGCVHLVAFGGPEPDEFKAIYELELLSGEGGLVK
jgi:hypothetical protein